MTEKRQNRVRAAGMVVRDDALLVMFRRRDGRVYYTFPGGMVEEGESPEETVAREIAEEASIAVTVGRLCYQLYWSGDTSRNAREYFYLCTYMHGEPALAAESIERKINDPEKNFFEPQWIAVSDLQKETPLFPTEVAVQFFHDIVHGFQQMPLRIEGSTIGG